LAAPLQWHLPGKALTWLLPILPEEEADAKETMRVIEATGQIVIAMPGDLNDAGYCDELVTKTIKELGSIDILVNNAALQKHFDSLEDITGADFADI